MVSIAFLVLSFPFTVVFSPFIAICSFASLGHDCNEVVNARVMQVNRIDAMRCTIDAFVYSKNTNITLPPILCRDVATCRHALHMHHNQRLVDECTNITIGTNRWYGKESCLEIVTDKNYVWMESYEDTYAWFVKGLIEMVLLIGMFAMMSCNDEFAKMSLQ